MFRKESLIKASHKYVAYNCCIFFLFYFFYFVLNKKENVNQLQCMTHTYLVEIREVKQNEVQQDLKLDRIIIAALL